MWLNHLANYIFFLLEAITIVVAILFVITGIIAAASKTKGSSKGNLQVKAVHDKYKKTKQKLEHTVFKKNELKKELKAEKKLIKLERKNNKKENLKAKKLFIIRFKGDLQASQVDSLREEVTAILRIATPNDEVVIILESGGGVVHGYGLAASQLERIKQNHIPLTVIVDKVAASGGYMMAVIADKLIAAPFAIIGSIGVVAQLPNFNRFLDEHGVDMELHTAGKFKRTLTMFGKNDEKGREKFREELEAVHNLFKKHIEKFRPSLNMDKVATGEYWFGHDALELELVDELMTSDDYLLFSYEKKKYELFEIEYKIKKSKLHKLASSAQKAFLQPGI